mgnify:CR=1 FL=1
MSVSPGWYDDPQRPGVERFHDGRAWTAHVRNDLPDIPLAPWVDSRTVVRPVDARPPRSTRAAASAVGLGLLGIVLVTWAGASTTVAALGNGAVEPVVAPTEGGDPVLPLHDCDDVATATASLAREYGDLPLAGWAGAPVTVADHQPVTALPPEGEQYLVLECTAAAEFTDGSVGEVLMSLSVDSDAAIWVDYAQQ